METKPISLPCPTSDVEQGKKNLEVFGVTIHKDFISGKQAEFLKSRLEDLAEIERKNGDSEFAYGEIQGGEVVGGEFSFYKGRPVNMPLMQQVSLLINKDRSFLSLTTNPVALMYAEHVLCTKDFHVGAEGGVIMRKGCPAQSIHVDRDKMVPCAIPYASGMVVMVALSEFEEDMGATQFVPGTHVFLERELTQRHSASISREISKNIEPLLSEEVDHHPEPSKILDAAKTRTVSAVVRPGSAIIWEDRVLHGRGAVTSDKPRYSYGTFYRPEFLRNLSNHSDKVHPEVRRSLSDIEAGLYKHFF